MPANLPTLLTQYVTWDIVEAVDTDGASTGRAVVLTFHGDTLVDGEKITGTKMQAVMPVDAFPPLLWHLENFAIVNGLRAARPIELCPSQFISLGPALPFRSGSWQHGENWRCTLAINHPGWHIDAKGQTWTTKQADESFDRWEHVSRRDGDATAASFPR